MLNDILQADNGVGSPNLDGEVGVKGVRGSIEVLGRASVKKVGEKQPFMKNALSVLGGCTPCAADASACPELDPLAGGRHLAIARRGTADFEFHGVGHTTAPTQAIIRPSTLFVSTKKLPATIRGIFRIGAIASQICGIGRSVCTPTYRKQFITKANVS